MQNERHFLHLASCRRSVGFGAVLAIFLGFSISGCATTNTGKTAADAFAAADSAASRGDCASAVPLYQTALARDPRFISALRGLGSCAQRIGDYPTAVSAYNKALAIAPQEYDLYLLRGGIEGAEGNITAAISDARRARDLAPREMSAYSAIAALFANEQDYTEAIQMTSTEVKFSPKYWALYKIRGDLYLSSQNFDLAQKDYTTALSLTKAAPERATIYAALAQSYQQQRQYAKAIGSINSALAADNTNSSDYGLAGNIYADALKRPEAIAAFRNAIKYAPTAGDADNLRIQFGDFYAKLGDAANARAQYQPVATSGATGNAREAAQRKLDALRWSRR